MEITKFASDLPYPKVEADRNLNEAKLIMPHYSGNMSELTAVLTYCYQNYVTPSYEDVRRAVLGVAKCEMLHHKLLGDTIVKLGGYPIMAGRTYFNGSFVNYTVDPKKFLDQNIAAEQNVILNYERLILNLKTESIKALIERIILDEELHIEIFKELKSSL